MVMEYMAGGDLYTLLERKGKVRESEARCFFQQIVAGLAHCHSLNICHRDIKLENLLLDSDNNVKLCDFGFARMCSDGNFCKTMCGTPNYCAPEVLAHENYYGAAADVWSLGIVLYALLVGSLPFDDVNLSSLYAKASIGCYSEPRHVTATAKTLLRKMLNPNPVTRITLEDIQATAWFRRKLPAYIQQHLVTKEAIDVGLVEKGYALKYFSSRIDCAELLSQLALKKGSFYLSYELLKTEQDRVAITNARAEVKLDERAISLSSPSVRIQISRSQAGTSQDWSYGISLPTTALSKVKPTMEASGMTLERFSKNQFSVAASSYKFEATLYTTEAERVIDFKYTGGSYMNFFDKAASVVAATQQPTNDQETSEFGRFRIP